MLTNEEISLLAQSLPKEVTSSAFYLPTNRDSGWRPGDGGQNGGQSGSREKSEIFQYD